MRIIGMDLSLNHIGIVSLDSLTSQVHDWFYITDKKNHFINDKDHCHWLHFSKRIKEDKNNFRQHRLDYVAILIYRFIQRQAVGPTRDMYVAIEDYSYNSTSRSTYQIGELGGVVRQTLFSRLHKLRCHDPLSVKLFATGHGHCLKKDIVDKAIEEGFNVLENKKLRKDTTKEVKRSGVITSVPELDGPVTDLADAYFLARMLDTELQLRTGVVTLEQLPENKRNIFLRVTKTYPVNILAMPFICKEQIDD